MCLLFPIHLNTLVFYLLSMDNFIIHFVPVLWFYQIIQQTRHTLISMRFDSRWCHWNFSLTKSFRPHYSPRIYSASNINEYQECFLGGKGGRCVGLTNLPPSCADCLETCLPPSPGTLRACPGLYRDCCKYRRKCF